METVTDEEARVDLEHTDVLIVGAGPAGLATAIELGHRGISCVVVERSDRVGYAPRAKTTNVRTRTHLRRWGIADKLAERAPMGIDYPADVHFVTSLSGKLIASFQNAFNGSHETSDLYPEHAQWVPQYALEEVLRDHVETLPSVRLRFSTALSGLVQDHDGVTAHIECGGATGAVRAKYIVGADGARSMVRDLIGAKMEGTYGLSMNYNIVFRSPELAKAHNHPPGIMYWQINAAHPGLIGPMDRGDIWFFMPTGVNEEKNITSEEAHEMIVAATGLYVDCEILSSDFWVASMLLADRYRDRRVFLVGDACHLHPPFGGFGMNMGVGDSVDLGWKIAAVLQNWAAPSILDSYEIERRQIHQRVMDEANANHSVLANNLVVPKLDEDSAEGEAQRRSLEKRILKEKAREFYSLGTVLGSCYVHSPIILADRTSSQSDGSRYVPSSVPGCLAPHVWLETDVSLYDRFGAGLTLLVRDCADDAVDKVIADAAEARIPLHVEALPSNVSRELYPAKFTLIRPDQFVCWRGDEWRAEILALVTSS